MKESMLMKKIQIGELELKNRFVMPAMNSHYTENNCITENGIAYYREHARGGFGLCITEFTAVDPDGLGSYKEQGVWSDEFVPSLQKLTTAIHEENGRIFLQLHHAGMIAKSFREDFKLKAPARTYTEDGEELEAFTIEELEAITERFIAGAIRAKQAGFDGVEVHGGHGYLINNFLSPRLNTRADSYGGNYVNRFRLAREIISGIKRACGLDYPVSFRLNAVDGTKSGDCTIEDSCIYANMAEQAGADCIHVSNANAIATYFYDPGFNEKYARAIKRCVSVPVIVVGRINDENVAESIVNSGAADMISMGRQSICDPHLPQKLKAGKPELIYHCMACMQRCSPDIGCEEGDVGISCMLNPFTGKELKWKLQEAKEKKNISIIGAGCAGMQAAWVMAARGHQVTIYEMTDHVGGNLLAAGAPPKKQGFIQAVLTLKAHCDEYGVIFKMNQQIAQSNTDLLKSDEIVIATGSNPWAPNIPGLSGYPTAEDVLLGKKWISNKRVAILGGGSVGLETAEYLTSFNNKIEVFEMKDVLAEDMVQPIRKDLLQRLKNNVVPHTGAKLVRVEDNKLELEMGANREITEQFDEIILAMGYRNNNPFSEWEGKQNVNVIGDAKRARNAKMAIYEATKLALEI